MLIILHGLFGAQTNWQSLAPRLAQGRRVIVPDLRNHGHSPWSDSMSYEEMAEDIHEIVHALDLPKITILGHSLGGKVAMTFALDYFNHTEKLIVVDARPGAHRPLHIDIADALVHLSLEGLSARSAADQLLSKQIPDATMRAFILKNLIQDGGQWRWQVNVQAIRRQYETEIVKAIEPAGRQFVGPVLFIKGGKSNYIPDTICDEVRGYFPQSRLSVIKNAGHWVHAEAPEEFLRVVNDFILSSSIPSTNSN